MKTLFSQTRDAHPSPIKYSESNTKQKQLNCLLAEALLHLSFYTLATQNEHTLIFAGLKTIQLRSTMA